jgi:hypothetical protein
MMAQLAPYPGRGSLLRHLRFTERVQQLPIRSGVAPYGSCYLQAVSNLIAFAGVAAAAQRMCPSWGFGEPTGGVLPGAGRWPDLVNDVFGTALIEQHPQDHDDAAAVEGRALETGTPVAAVVDAFHIPSPVTGNTHFAHCVLLIGTDPRGVTVIDPMNRPEPTRYNRAEWSRMRSAACVDRFRMFTCPGSARRYPSPHELFRIVVADSITHSVADGNRVTDYLSHAGAAQVLTIDVAGVAAERAYLADLLTDIARQRPGLRDAADSVASLARRWYLLHTMGIARPDARGPQLERLLSMLRTTVAMDLRARSRITYQHQTTPPPEEP